MVTGAHSSRRSSLTRAAPARTRVELKVWPDNQRAIRLYESLGFTVEGVRRNHYRRRDGTLRSAVLMARILPREDGVSPAPGDPPDETS